jgi:hypothetical protein
MRCRFSAEVALTKGAEDVCHWLCQCRGWVDVPRYFGKKALASTEACFLPTPFRHPWSTSTTTLSAEGFVGVPWTGNDRRPDTTLM